MLWPLLWPAFYPIFFKKIFQQGCSDDWEEHGDRCYYWSTDKKTWNEAEAFCQQENGHLASITSEAINQYFLDGWNSRGRSRTWIGGNDIDKEGTWIWTDGSPFDFTFWHPSEPNNYGNEDCLHLSRGSWLTVQIGGRWNDRPCSYSMTFVCSMKKEKISGRKVIYKWPYAVQIPYL